MLRITPAIAISESELDEQNIRASGPGGQKVNKTATAVKLRFDVKNSFSLPGEVRQRLMIQQKNRINKEGIF